MKSRWLTALVAASVLALGPIASGQQESADALLREAQNQYRQGMFFSAARFAYEAQERDRGVEGQAYSWITAALMRAGLGQSASYFFIRTLQSGDKGAIRRVLPFTQELLARIGSDLPRKYLIRHTTYEDYDPQSRSAYLFALAKDALLTGDMDRAIGYVDGMSKGSPLYPYGLQLRASAHAVAGRTRQALGDFKACRGAADQILELLSGEGLARAGREKALRGEARDLEARCQAGIARTLYENGKFEEADREYDRIPKASFVWPDILFEQAWNSYARGEFNRTLGKLVSYKSPALRFVWNSEVDVLRAQTYLALCLYEDADKVLAEFEGRYGKLAREIKKRVEGPEGADLSSFHELGRKALAERLDTPNDLHRLANRFVRGPYFQALIRAEQDVEAERAAIRSFAGGSAQGLSGFLQDVLKWRLGAISKLGGAFVRNSLLDYHDILISDFEKMSFIRIEVLDRLRTALLKPKLGAGERKRGVISTSRRDDQYWWSFNGEFWTDELGDYVFGLESECRVSDAAAGAESAGKSSDGGEG